MSQCNLIVVGSKSVWAPPVLYYLSEWLYRFIPKLSWLQKKKKSFKVALHCGYCTLCSLFHLSQLLSCWQLFQTCCRLSAAFTCKSTGLSAHINVCPHYRYLVDSKGGPCLSQIWHPLGCSPFPLTVTTKTNEEVEFYTTIWGKLRCEIQEQ